MRFLLRKGWKKEKEKEKEKTRQVGVYLLNNLLGFSYMRFIPAGVFPADWNFGKLFFPFAERVSIPDPHVNAVVQHHRQRRCPFHEGDRKQGLSCNFDSKSPPYQNTSSLRFSPSKTPLSQPIFYPSAHRTYEENLLVILAMTVWPPSAKIPPPEPHIRHDIERRQSDAGEKERIGN